MFTDFELRTSDGAVLRTHKVILATRSPMFSKMLSIDMQEAAKGSADVPDFNSIVMKEVLRFIYCNSVENLEVIAGELIYAAEKYQLEGLKEICLNFIMPSVSIGNVLDFLIISDQISKADKLFDKCIDLTIR